MPEDPHPGTELAELSSWRSLFDLSRRPASDKPGIQKRVDAWSRHHAGRPIAVFLEGDDGYSRFVTAGGPFPEDLAEVDGDFRRLELPGIVAVLAADAEPDSPLLLTLAGVRIHQLKKQLQRQSFQAMFRGVELEALYEVGLAIASTLDLEQLGEEVLLRAVLLLDARRGALYLLEGEHYRRVSHLGGTAAERLDADSIDETALREHSGGVPADCLPGARHLLASLVELDGHARGLLVVADKERRTGVGPFPPNDQRTLALFANQAAIALENAKLHRLALEKERLEREMELAAEIQQQLLPTAMPSLEGYEVIGWNRPARQVGGDYFGFQSLEDARLSIVLGDVTGKGMPASLLVSTLHSALRLLLDRHDVGPALVERLNRHICEASSANKFITLVLAVLDPLRHELTYVNAGHNPGVLIRADASVTELSSHGLPVGLLPQGRYGQSQIELEEGDLVCLYSDGITECEAPDDEQYGLERLVDLLIEQRHQPLDDVLKTIDRAMLRWADGAPQGDDQTVVLLRRTPSTG